MALIDFITASVPEFERFIEDVPDWYRQSQDYGIAIYFLDFTVSLLKANDRVLFTRIMELVETGISGPPEISDPLCIDFVERIADLGTWTADFLAQLGPRSRECYDAQF